MGTSISDGRFIRSEMLIGEEALNTLSGSTVAVFGIGGVGGYVSEALARSGVGHLELIDKDTVDLSNLNRQLIATEETLGRPKAELMRERILAINPDADVRTRQRFFLPENASEFRFEDYDYVVDAVDTITAKIEIVMRCREAGTPVISSMGTGNKLDPSALRAVDLFDTKVCPLARVMRRELKKRGVTELKVVYSEEEPRRPRNAAPEGDRRKDVPGSMVFVPAAAGLLIASVVVRDLTGLS